MASGFLENLFAPFGDFYETQVANNDSRETEQDSSNHGWFETFGELPEDEKGDFAEWWFEHYLEDDFPYSWEDFREKYGSH